jgi:hypothetical protein
MAKRIPLTRGQFAIVDDEDFDWLNGYKWYADWNNCTQSFYARRNGVKPDGKRYAIRMHREILGLRFKDKRKGDHIKTGKTLDNRRLNLRVATTQQNGFNQTNHSNNRLGLKGVSFHKHIRRFQAQIRIKGKVKCLGYYPKAKEAARAYDRGALRYHGQFANLNFPREDYANG